MIKAVGLDLDDTLYDRNQVYEKTYQIMEQKVLATGISFQDFNDLFQQESQIEFQKFTQGIKGEVEFKIDRILSTYQRLGYPLKHEQALRFNELYLHHKKQIELRPGMSKLIDYLCSIGIELFVLTNGAKETQSSKLHYLGIDKLVPPKNSFISDEMGVAKPVKKIFDLVEDSLGLAGNEILYIGDHYENDILGCQQNDWTAVYYNVNNVTVEDENLVQFSTDQQVYEYVKNLLV
ncbi:HAD family hydrolase [Desemzia sp. RIT804]|uniref:HAD family hydrolase n=1 Tax=Desemzia sp. RIT 804 TaxID=2810209 RepID=UPI001951C247|nr:HAD family hydrolase [Desemzia sp. RIT 804]